MDLNTQLKKYANGISIIPLIIKEKRKPNAQTVLE